METRLFKITKALTIVWGIITLLLVINMFYLLFGDDSLLEVFYFRLILIIYIVFGLIISIINLWRIKVMDKDIRDKLNEFINKK